MSKKKTSKRSPKKKRSRIARKPPARKRKKKKWKVRFTHPGEPRTKSNSHYFFKGRMVIPKRVRDYEKSLKETAANYMKNSGKRPTTRLVKVKAIYYLGTKRRKDLQNLPKSTCDALEGVVFNDDSQIHKLQIEKKLDRKNPRVCITVELMSDTGWTKG
jgi:Holliday junction resolvase RusA-like endonuclease